MTSKKRTGQEARTSPQGAEMSLSAIQWLQQEPTANQILHRLRRGEPWGRPWPQGERVHPQKPATALVPE